MAELSRGQIWQYEFAQPDRRRPVLILSRRDVIPLLQTVIVAPITSSVRGSPAEVLVGAAEGLKHDSAVNLDHVQTVPKARLRRFVGTADRQTMQQVCAALAIATGCDRG